MQSKRVFLIKALQNLLPKLAAKIAFADYITAYKVPVRDIEQPTMAAAKTSYLEVNGKRVKVYTWGSGEKAVLFVHGWCSRASRFYSLVNHMLRKGYVVISFDAPGHGESSGNTTSILEYHQALAEIQKLYPDFHAVIAHSLGVLYSIYALKHGVLRAKKLICISGVCQLENTIDNFIRKYQLNKSLTPLMRLELERQFSDTQNIWEQFSAHMPPRVNCEDMLIIHDEDDNDVKITQSQLLFKEYQAIATYYQTQELGHLRILLSDEVHAVIDNYLI